MWSLSKEKIPTINVNPVGKTGPLAKFITEEYYVSDVSPNCISVVDGEDMPQNLKKIKVKIRVLLESLIIIMRLSQKHKVNMLKRT